MAGKWRKGQHRLAAPAGLPGEAELGEDKGRQGPSSAPARVEVPGV